MPGRRQRRAGGGPTVARMHQPGQAGLRVPRAESIRRGNAWARAGVQQDKGHERVAHTSAARGRGGPGRPCRREPGRPYAAWRSRRALAAEPSLAAALERQRAALCLLSGLTQPAPLDLRRRVCALRRRRRGIVLRRWLPLGFVATATAAAALMLLLAGGAPAVDVVAVALRPADRAAGRYRAARRAALPAPGQLAGRRRPQRHGRRPHHARRVLRARRPARGLHDRGRAAAGRQLRAPADARARGVPLGTRRPHVRDLRPGATPRCSPT